MWNKKMEPPSLVASAAFAKIPPESKRGPSSLAVWLLSRGAFTLAETGLVAQMKLSCLLVFGEWEEDGGRGAFRDRVSMLEQQEKKLRESLNVTAFT